MKSAINAQASTYYGEIFEKCTCMEGSHPAMQRMQELSDQVPGSTPTAIDRLEVYKECYRLADDLYRLTGNKKLFNHVLRIGDLLLSRIFNNKPHSLHANQ